MTNSFKLSNKEIANFLLDKYGLKMSGIRPISGGADQNAWVYKATAGKSAYFLKIRKGKVDRAPLLVQQYLQNQGISEILAPIQTNDQKSWVTSGDFTLMLYPFVEGKSNAESPMTESNWIEFGKALKKIHSIQLSQSLESQVRRESFSQYYSEAMIKLLARIQQETFTDVLSLKLVEFLKQKHDDIYSMLDKAQRYRNSILNQALEVVLCHTDIHAGNRMIDSQGHLKIIDFDEPMMAPKERDLMYFGSGIIQLENDHDISLFYQGYGKTTINHKALTYYRFKRIIEDIVLFAEDILFNSSDASEREAYFGYLTSNFLPGNTLEMAYRAEENILRP